MNITELDKKILFELDKDGRASFSEMARAIGTTPQVVKYRYERLMETGIIKHFWAFIDYDKAGYSFFWGYWLKFSGLTKEDEENMYADFKENKFIPIVMRCDGYADVLLGIIGRDLFYHNEVLNNVFAKYGKFIAASDIVVGLGFIKFPRTYFVGKQNESREFSISGGTKKTASLSEADRKILSILQVNGRMEFTKIAKVLGVSAGLVHKHFNRLVKDQIITKITYTIGYQKIGLLLYRVLFKIVQYDEKRINDLYDFCAKHPNIINYVKIMGNWQLILDIEIESRKDLRDLIREMKNEFKDIIRQVEINEIYEIDKFTQMAIEYPELMK